jgi:hypothetical protein
MSVIIQGDQLRGVDLGFRVKKAALALSAATLPAFNVLGGEVLVTSIHLKVTTSITTNGGTVAVNNVPTAGNTMTLVTATDLGTTDTVAGSVVGLDRAATVACSFLVGGRIDLDAVVTTGVLNVVGAAAVNGACDIVITYVPLTNGASIVAV